MALSIEALPLHPGAAPIMPPRPPQVSAVGERDGAGNERRSGSKSNGDRASAAFRSFLSAATMAGLAQAVGARGIDGGEGATEPKRKTKLPSGNRRPETLSGAETDRLYQAVRSRAPDPSPPAREFRIAATNYAKTYFAVAGTLYRPGETLELTA